MKVICHYRVIRGKEGDFEKLLGKHWTTLHQLGLVTDEPSQCFKGEEQDNGEPIYFEMFEWRGDGVDRAHSHPQVMAIWGPMDELCEARGGKPNMEFPHVQTVTKPRSSDSR